ncbi:hypothetical protein CDI09_14750 [Komagataeibacter nataicola]|uniref:Integrase catalytic domain-containing protein n=1 Tax=Komagataeibacter nataicola TaxID=265960 RepID=A0ABX5P7I4_9PROT|nr:integrase core domain-containing protein [Komagataeibacter nataicola]PYD65199.1 hypothetical protein CDI09_14750 [Komagataeibacter nataicola]
MQKSRPNGHSSLSHTTAKEWHGFTQHKPGQPRRYPPQNARPNRLLRDECLNETLFTSLTHARQILADWREDYNTVRPHSQLDGRTPDQVARQASRGHAPETLVIPSTPNHKNRKLSF